MSWIDRVEDEICERLDKGEITEEEFNNEMKSLYAEVQAGAEEAAGNAYDDYMGNC